MELKRITLNRETVAQYFPELLSEKENYDYFIEICALRIPNRKTVQKLHMQAARSKTEGELLMRELYSRVPVVIAHLDKPMRQAQRDTIYFEAKKKLQERIELGIVNNLITHEHPYAQAIAGM